MDTHKSQCGTIFHHHSELEGEVIALLPKQSVIPSDDSGSEFVEVHIPGADILEFVAYSYVLGKLRENINRMSINDLLLNGIMQHE